MYSRPRRLFQEIGLRTGANWLRQPRTQSILVEEAAARPSAAAREAIAVEETRAAVERLQ